MEPDFICNSFKLMTKKTHFRLQFLVEPKRSQTLTEFERTKHLTSLCSFKLCPETLEVQRLEYFLPYRILASQNYLDRKRPPRSPNPTINLTY